MWYSVPRSIIELHNHLATLITKYCSVGNVKHCSFDEFKGFSKIVGQNLPFFTSLESLRLKLAINYDEFQKIITFATTLKLNKFEIIVMNCDNRMNFFEIIAGSKFETCIVDYDDDYKHPQWMYEPKTLNVLIPTNLTIKYLDLGRLIYDPALLVHFPNIESLIYLDLSIYTLEPSFNQVEGA